MECPEEHGAGRPCRAPAAGRGKRARVALPHRDERVHAELRSETSRAAWHASDTPMIGVFDSGHGGLTVFRALVRRFPAPALRLSRRPPPRALRQQALATRSSTLTRDGVEALFRRGCQLVLLGCNTATCVAARTLQKDWLPVSGWSGRNMLGIVAPTVEAATQTPWAVASPQYPQKYNTDVVAVFGTTRTITSHAYPEEIRKRCPKVTVVQQTCAELVGAIERGAPERELDALVAAGRRGAAGADGGHAAASRHPGLHALSAGRAPVPAPSAALHAPAVAARGGGRQPGGLSQSPSALSRRA